jgi:hypothetical protein
MKFRWVLAALCAAAGLAASPAGATVTFDDDVTSNFINGSGTANGGFTVDRTSGVELAIRGKLRFDANNQAQNTFNSNHDGSYTFAAGSPDLSKPHSSWADATTPIWSFDWSINTNHDGSSAYPHVGDLTYRMDIDFNPGVGATNFLSFDPIYGLVPGKLPTDVLDHSFGDNSTGQGAGFEASTAGQYGSYLTSYNVAQNSWNMEFYDAPASSYTFNPNVGGEYTIKLTALDGLNEVSSVSVNVLVAVPEASSFLAVGLVGLVGWCAKKRLGA